MCDVWMTVCSLFGQDLIDIYEKKNCTEEIIRERAGTVTVLSVYLLVYAEIEGWHCVAERL